MTHMAKKGCGAAAAFMLVLLALLMVGSNEALGYYYSHCKGEDILDCLFRGLEEPEPKGVVATGVYSFKGYDVTVTMNIPLEGGGVTGTVSGACDGSLQGTFSGQENGAISGTMAGACSPFFVNIPASAEYSGSVNKGGKTVPISFSGRGGGLSKNGSLTLTYN